MPVPCWFSNVSSAAVAADVSTAESVAKYASPVRLTFSTAAGAGAAAAATGAGAAPHWNTIECGSAPSRYGVVESTLRTASLPHMRVATFMQVLALDRMPWQSTRNVRMPSRG